MFTINFFNVAGDRTGFAQIFASSPESLYNMIHYTMVKTTFFNGVRHPSIGKFDEQGKFHLLHKFTYEQFKEKL